eukprot:Nk52_evm19s249 gene=Nk52_evmTU19s249
MGKSREVRAIEARKRKESKKRKLSKAAKRLVVEDMLKRKRQEHEVGVAGTSMTQAEKKKMKRLRRKFNIKRGGDGEGSQEEDDEEDEDEQSSGGSSVGSGLKKNPNNGIPKELQENMPSPEEDDKILYNTQYAFSVVGMDSPEEPGQQDTKKEPAGTGRDTVGNEENTKSEEGKELRQALIDHAESLNIGPAEEFISLGTDTDDKDNEVLGNPEDFFSLGGKSDKKGGSEGTGGEKKKIEGLLWDVPWVTRVYSRNLIVALHEEIVDCVNWLTHTAPEHQMRTDLVQRFNDVITTLWPGQCSVRVFGSFETLLYLPTSDIDICVFGPWTNPPLFDLAKALKRAGILSNIKVIDKARVPIIKCVDKMTNISVDISFNLPAGVETAELVKKYIRDYPPLYPLVFVVKQFLSIRQLNEVFTGGLSSFSIILMVVSFLQLHPRLKTPHDMKTANLGVLLIEFLELYGVNFNYVRTGISVRNGGRYYPKGDYGRFDEYKPMSLSIEDPLSPENDISKGSFNIQQIRLAFSHSFRFLSSVIVADVQTAHTFFHGPTLLSSIIRMDQDTVEFRKWVDECWEAKHNREGNETHSVSKKHSNSLLGKAPTENIASDRNDRKLTLTTARGFVTSRKRTKSADNAKMFV